VDELIQLVRPLALAHITDVLEFEICGVRLDVNDVATVRIGYGGTGGITASDGLHVGQGWVLARVGVHGNTGCGTTSRRARAEVRF